MSAFFNFPAANYLLYLELYHSDEKQAKIYLKKASDLNCDVAKFALALNDLDQYDFAEELDETKKSEAIISLEKLVKDEFCPAVLFKIEELLDGYRGIFGTEKNDQKAYQLMNELLNISGWKSINRDIVSNIEYPNDIENGRLYLNTPRHFQMYNYDYSKSAERISNLIAKEYIYGSPSRIEIGYGSKIFATQIPLLQERSVSSETYYMLGKFFETGVGCLQNYASAYAFYSHAAVFGHSLAVERRDVVASFLSQKERTEANRNLEKYRKIHYGDLFPKTQKRRLEKIMGIKV